MKTYLHTLARIVAVALVVDGFVALVVYLATRTQ